MSPLNLEEKHGNENSYYGGDGFKNPIQNHLCVTEVLLLLFYLLEGKAWKFPAFTLNGFQALRSVLKDTLVAVEWLLKAGSIFKCQVSQ